MSTASSPIQDLLSEELQLLRDFHRLTQEVEKVGTRLTSVRSAVEGYRLAEHIASQTAKAGASE